MWICSKCQETTEDYPSNDYCWSCGSENDFEWIEKEEAMSEEKKEKKEEKLNIMQKLGIIQTELSVPKKQYNSYSDFYYRSCEDIMEAVKPYLQKLGLSLVMTDDVVQIGERYYIRATATLADLESQQTYTTHAFAREQETKTKMDASQITGATSTYARKYCLNGLLAIDDVRDADATNTHGKEEPKDELDKKIEEGEAKANDPITDKELKLLREVLEKRGEGAIDKCKEFFKVGSLEMLTRGQYVDAVRMMNKEKK